MDWMIGIVLFIVFMVFTLFIVDDVKRSVIVEKEHEEQIARLMTDVNNKKLPDFVRSAAMDTVIMLQRIHIAWKSSRF